MSQSGNLPEIDPSFDAIHPQPFTGREAALSYFYQYLNDPHPQRALLYIGQRLTGKTALLYHFDTVLEELDLVVFLPLDADVCQNSDRLLQSWYQAAYDRIVAAGFSENRLPVLPRGSFNWRDWLAETGMPDLVSVLRGGRRLIFLLDDVDYLLDAISEKRLPADMVAYLQRLLRPSLYLVLTVNLANEDRLSVLSPLINPAEAYRLRYLMLEELAGLYPGPDLDQVHQVSERIYRLTGGHPALAQYFNRCLRERTAAPILTVSDVDAVAPQVYRVSLPIYRELSASLNPTEHLVLTAIVNLRYEDPLKPITAAEINAWLVETEFQMDSTAINAALRSLEYRELVTIERGAVTMTAEFFQKWVLENTDASRPVTQPSIVRFAPLPVPEQHRALWLAIAVAIILFMIVMMALALDQPPTISRGDIPPTITLVPGNTLTP
ncbi:MAG TPA: hypothetical protein VHL11_16665 [Phototrophicaceae bacterium]|nr:hypothetical protein [Phototrophicaceae bacterium]